MRTNSKTGRTEDHWEAAEAFVEKRAHFHRPVKLQSISLAVLEK
jgi:hypothetical protein